jgi:hypothetical protein
MADKACDDASFPHTSGAKRVIITGKFRALTLTLQAVPLP